MYIKFTFVQIDKEIILVKSFQNVFNIFLVLFKDIRINEDIIQKYNIDLIDKTFQIFIDNCIKGR